MKKLSIVLVIIIFVVSCAKKVAPTTANGGNNNMDNGKAIVANNVEVKEEVKMNPPQMPVANDPTAQVARDKKTATAATPEMKGQATYNAKCGNCHGLKVTTDYTVNRWITVMQVMAVKANLTNDEKENVLAYVKANAKP